MDDGLSAGIGLAVCEREALFSILVRFEAEILAFQRNYCNLCQSRDEDLKYRKDNADAALETFDRAHRDTLAEMKSRRDSAISGQNGNLRKKETDQNNRLADYSEKIRRQSERENETLTALDNQDRAYDASDKALLESFWKYCGNVSLYYKARKTNAKKFDDPAGAVVNSVADARACLNEEKSTELSAAWRELERLNGSLLLRLFCSGKISRLCSQIVEGHKNAAAAYLYLTECRRRAAEERNEAHQRQEANRQDQLDCLRHSLEEETQKYRQIINQQISAINNEYNRSVAALTSENDRERKSREASQCRSLAEASAKWSKDCQTEFSRFVAALREKFPPEAMYSMLEAAWKGRPDFRVIQQNEASRSVLIGTAYINANGRKWYNGESGTLISTVLTRLYWFLFRPVNQNGNLVPDLSCLMLPYKLSLERGENLLFRCAEPDEKAVQSYAQAAAMRMMWAIPVGQCQLLLADPYAIGSFSGLSALDPATGNKSGTAVVRSILNGEKVCSNVEEIRQGIQDNAGYYNKNSAQMNSYRSLREYNAKNPMSLCNFLIAVFQHFPRGMNESTLRLLQTMSSDCGKYGFSSIMVSSDVDANLTDPKLKAAQEELTGRCTILRAIAKNGQLFFLVSNGTTEMERGAVLALDPLPNEETRRNMKTVLRDAMLKADSLVIDFERATDIYPSPREKYSCSARDGIVVPVGYWSGGEPFKIVFDDKRVHTLINGQTGSGKTNLLHVLITNTMLRYTPEEVELYLIDFKHGSETIRYTHYNLPSFRALCRCNEPEFALKMLRKIKNELLARTKAFEEANYTNSLKSYNQRMAATGGKKLSRIIIVIDEIFQLTKDAEASGNTKVKAEILKLIQEFAVQSRTYGIHMVISSQNLTTITEMETIKKSCAIRIGFQCSDSELTRLVHPDAPGLMRTISSMEKGACIVRPGENERPGVVHIAFIEPDDQHFRILEELHNHYMERQQYTQAEYMVTDAVSDMTCLYQRFAEFGDLSEVLANRFLLGESLSETDPNEIDLSGGNLWVAGGTTGMAEDAGRSICFYALLSMLLQNLAGGGTRECIYFFNGCADSRGPTGSEKDRAGELGVSLSASSLTYVTGGQVFQKYLKQLYAEVEKRRSAGGDSDQPLWLLFQQPERCDGLTTQTMQMLYDILQLGPSVGIRSVIWTKDAQAAIKMQFHTLPMRETGVLAMDAGMYQQVLGQKPVPEPEAWYLYRKGGNRTRVFDLPEKAWIEKLVQQFKLITNQKVTKSL